MGAREIATIVLLDAAFLVLGGCVTVDPQSDYELAAQRIISATGQAEAYLPDEEGAAKARTEELLKGGLTADEAVQVGLLKNPGLQAEYRRVGIARAEVVESGLFSNPSLALSILFPNGGGLGNLEADLGQNIAQLWGIGAKKETAERALDKAVHELTQEAVTLAIAIRSTYYGAVSAHRLVEINEENRLIAEELLEAVRVRREAGAGTEVEINLSRSELLDTELLLRKARLKAFEERAKLAALLGVSMRPGELHLTDILPDPPNWRMTPEGLLRVAQKHRPDLQAANEAVQAAAAKVKLERRSVFPLLEIGTRVEFSKGGDDSTIGPLMGGEVPIFNQNQAGIARAQYAYAKMKKLQENLLLQVIRQARTACERAGTAWDVARFLRDELLPLRKGSLELAHEAYRLGRLPFASVLEAQRTLLAARAEYVESLLDSVTAIVELEKVAGRPIKEILRVGFKADMVENVANQSAAQDPMSEIQVPEGEQ